MKKLMSLQAGSQVEREIRPESQISAQIAAGAAEQQNPTGQSQR
jgi:hypothetical protein